jgi:O-methyltransferase
MNGQKKKVVIWGAKHAGIRALNVLRYRFEVVAFIDRIRLFQGQSHDGIKVCAPEQITELQFDYLVIANRDGENLKNMLKQQYGLGEDRVLDFCANEVQARLFGNYNIVVNLQLFSDLFRKIREENLGGALAEVGVYRGHCASYISRAFPCKSFYLFDTFYGFDQKDIDLERTRNYSSRSAGFFSQNSVELVLQQMLNRERCQVRAGHFPETAAGLEEEEFCFVHLDADLYAPSKSGLEFFYERLLPGGYILVHDYGNLRYPGITAAVSEFAREKGVPYVPLLSSWYALFSK